MIENPFANFEQAVYAIRDRGIEPFSGLAEKAIQRMRAREIMLQANYEPPRLRATTVFGMQPIPGSVRQEHYPVVMVELGDALTLENAVLQGDAVRTLAVVDQYPFNGYERRLRTVYQEALDTQMDWLTQTSAPLLPFDPRILDREELIKHLLGPAKYKLDIGFDDWQATADEIVTPDMSRRDRDTLKMLRESKEHFLVQRHHHQNLLYPTIAGLGAFDTMTEDQLRQYFCASLLGAALISKPPIEN